jgi:hypothetical protein
VLSRIPDHWPGWTIYSIHRSTTPLESLREQVFSANREIARRAFRSVLLGAPESGIPKYVSQYHYLQKHGPKATYGQS